MSQAEIRGAVKTQEIRHDTLVRDTRGIFAKMSDWLTIPTNVMSLLIFFAVLAFIVPAIADICLIVVAFFTTIALKKHETAPLKLPIQSNLIDLNQLHPGTGKPQKASGIFHLGNEIKTGKEVWLTNDDCRQHFLVLGTTGAGKTEALLGFAANAVAWGSGFLFCDGKGDVGLFSKVYALCRRFGREDDLLVLNYMTGNQDVSASGGNLMSNTLNPFATGSSDTLTQMVVGLMDDAGGDGAMWKGRATAMFTGVMRALTYLRDSGIIDLNVSEIRDHLQLKRIIDLADRAKYPDLAQPIRKSILSYLTSLPGFQEDKGYKQSQTTLDQHGYLEMQFTRILGSLADVYGHIFHTPYGEIDMNDVVLNRRILVIMLPALEKSGDEIANLGKIIVATLKGMMGGTLGSQIEGSWAKIVDNRVTNSESPFIVVLDEVGYYMVDGMDLMSAQARSLGFSLIFAGQDINAMKRLNEKVFGSVQGNTNTKIIMRTEDPDTAKLAVEAGGKTNRAVLKQFKGQNKEIGGRSYSDNMEAAIEEVDRINPLDLKAQSEGGMHIIHKDWLVRAKSFYANPESTVNKHNLKLRANHFITVARPDADEIQSQQKLPEIVQKMADPEFAIIMKADAEKALLNLSEQNEITEIAQTLDMVSKSPRRKSTLLEASCIAFAKILATSREVNAEYSKKVNSQTGASPNRIPESIGHINEMPDRQRLAKSDGLGIRDRRMHQRPDELVASEQDRESRPLITSSARPFGASRLRDVKHGAKVSGGAIHEMSDRLLSNDSVIKTLQALNFDERSDTREMVNNGIEEALLVDADEEFFEDIPFDEFDVNEASNYISNASKYSEDNEEDGDDEQEQGGTIDQFIFSLLDDDDEKNEEKK